MILAVLINVAWILWSLYKFLTGFEIYTGIYLRAYSIFFFAGLLAAVSGSILLKALYFRRRKSRWVKAGLGLWIAGFILFVICIFTGVNIPGSEILKQHVLFNHTNYMIFLVGMVVSVYLDTIIVSKLDPTAERSARNDEERK